jgi:type II secretory pathway pseudopilin PulG
MRRLKFLISRTERGFTLMEAIIIIVLVGIFMAAMGIPFVAGVRQSRVPETVAVAHFLAVEKDEELSGTAYASLSNEAKAAVPGYAGYEREVVVTEVSGVDLTTPQAGSGYRRVTVTVYHSDLAATGLSLVTLRTNALSAGPGARMNTGSYTGNGIDNRAITAVGFQPDVLIIGGNSADPTVCRTATMVGDATNPLAGATGLLSNRIQSLDANGFTIGSDTDVNRNGSAFYWVAFQAAPGELFVGSYIGNGADNRPITGVGFQPDYVIVMSESNDQAYQRSSSMVGDASFRFDNAGANTNRIQALLADGFQVGTNTDVNRNGTRYHFVAWKKVTGKMNVGAYVGNNTDNRNITGVGFAPSYVIVKQNGNQDGVHHMASQGLTTDSTLFFRAQASVTNRIQALQADGFQVGSDADVNQNGQTYYWMAFGQPLRMTAWQESY